MSSVAVYGPGSRARLVHAQSGAGINESPKEKTMRFYPADPGFSSLRDFATIAVS